MIVRVSRSGSSFKGLATYLTHDPKAETAWRVAWTHTLNTVHDDVPSAVHEMYTLYLDADLLKEQNGVRPGGRSVEKPVKHYSLNWHPSEEPTREQIIEAAESFMARMDIADHQAVVVCHTDRDHLHAHLMVNAIGPDGLKMSESYEHRRAQAWALNYEREHDRIFCEQRLEAEAAREANMTREAWLAMKEAERQHDASEHARRTFDAGYMARQDNAEVIRNEEWGLLKAQQRLEREAFFTEGKEAYAQARSEAYAEVRAAFKDEWADYYAALRAGGDAEALKDLRADIVERQNAALTAQRESMSAALREDRDNVYSDLLAEQGEQRDDLRSRQAQGFSSPHLLDLAYPVERGNTDADLSPKARDTGGEFRAAAQEVFARGEPLARHEDAGDLNDTAPLDVRGVKGAEDAVTSLGIGALGGLAMIGERFFDGFLGGEAVKTPPPIKRPAPEFPPDNPFARAAAQARQIAEDEELHRSQAYWEGRDRAREA